MSIISEFVTQKKQTNQRIYQKLKTLSELQNIGMSRKRKQNKNQDPFQIIYNYRSSGSIQSEVINQTNKPIIYKNQVEITSNGKQNNLNISDFLQYSMNENHELLRLQTQSPKRQEQLNENYQDLWGSSELEKGIPFHVQESQLDYESPLEMSNQRPFLKMGLFQNSQKIGHEF